VPQYVEMSAAERALLESPERPVVLLRSVREGCDDALSRHRPGPAPGSA
jgi:hydrogenase maturation factor HypF (carbamoyltransferase family)